MYDPAGGERIWASTPRRARLPVQPGPWCSPSAAQTYAAPASALSFSAGVRGDLRWRRAQGEPLFSGSARRRQPLLQLHALLGTGAAPRAAPPEPEGGARGAAGLAEPLGLGPPSETPRRPRGSSPRRRSLGQTLRRDRGRARECSTPPHQGPLSSRFEPNTFWSNFSGLVFDCYTQTGSFACACVGLRTVREATSKTDAPPPPLRGYHLPTSESWSCPTTCIADKLPERREAPKRSTRCGRVMAATDTRGRQPHLATTRRH